MPNIKLKDLKGREVVYQNVSTVNIPEEVSGIVAFSDTLNATASAENILKGKTAFINGKKVTGTAEVFVENKTLIMPEGLVTIK